VLASNTEFGLAYVYCNDNDQDQTVEKLIAAIAKQLLLRLDIPKRITEIFEELRREGRQISLDNALKILHLTCDAFSRVYICIDAIDEFEERDELLESLQKLPPSVRLFITGRDHVQDTIKRLLDQPVTVRIKANESDIRKLIQDRIIRNRKRDPKLMDQTLELVITERIVAWSTKKLVTYSFLAFESHLLTTL
jgi:hypothetical protein